MKPPDKNVNVENHSCNSSKKKVLFPELRSTKVVNLFLEQRMAKLGLLVWILLPRDVLITIKLAVDLPNGELS